MNIKNVNFGEDKLRIKIVNKQSITGQGGTVSILYEDISSLYEQADLSIYHYSIQHFIFFA